ncbi:MAG: GNAT family N-acetyltransferase [Clostridia bacterium]|nr:GNAT family N-acetyltransferase [Clostridia bacterium]
MTLLRVGIPARIFVWKRREKHDSESGKQGLSRRRGYAAWLLSACENCAKEKGCREFASDCELTNTDSLKFHLSLGFTEANRIICFTKKL